LKEFDFWDMTIAEVVRHIETHNKIKKIESQEKASYDYILASLIVKGFNITMGGKDTYPRIEEAYSGLFDDIKAEQEEKITQRNIELSVLRFKQFAQSYNNKKNKVVASNE
jgi:hypothetical protein